MRTMILALVVLGLAAPLVMAQVTDLSGGVFIAHRPPTMEFSVPPQGWCDYYIEDYGISSCNEQYNRIDATGQGSVWFVLAAWEEDKQWCGTEFGFGDYNPDIYHLVNWGPCFPHMGWELSTPGWPGPREGTMFVIAGDPYTPWYGNFVPVYYFVGYAYGEGVIPLDSTPGRGLLGRPDFGGTCNCLAQPVVYPAECFGAMGISTAGSPCCPSNLLHVCCLAEQCMLMSDDEQCMQAGGVWHPEWDSCEPNPCSPPEAVCCIGAVCTIVTEAECNALGGEWHGEWGSCVPNPCEPPSPTNGTTWGFIKALYR